MLIFCILIPSLLLIFTQKKPHWRLLKLISNYALVGASLELLFGFLQIPEAVQYALFFVFILLEASNLEHILNNDSNQSVRFIRFAFDPVFLKGSVISKRFFFRVLALETLLLPVAMINLQVSTSLLVGAICISFFLSYFIQTSSLLPEWSQENWIIFNIRNLLGTRAKQDCCLPSHVAYSEKVTHKNSEYNNLVSQDLGQGKWLDNQHRQNVLLLMIEGLGQLQLQKGWLPKLAARTKQNISCKTFLSLQRNTNRGVYSILTGKHPNLLSQIAKPDLVAQYGRMDVGLAEFLAQKDFKTVFIQGAPTSFMFKDKFLPKIGFAEVIGDEHFSKECPRIKWGLDDHHLYVEARNKIHELQKMSQNWLMSVLTVSTHHPFQAAGRNFKDQEEAYRYADEALDNFLINLETDGVLNNTTVFITSDETAGEAGNFLAHNLGFLTVLTPEKKQQELSTPFCQSDLAFSICDYLNFEDHPFHGRSLFRNYNMDRPLYFANIFQQKAYCFQNGKLLIQHYSGKREVLETSKLSLDEEIVESKTDVSFAEFNQFLEANDRDLSFLTTPVLLEKDAILPNGEKVIHSGGAVKIGLKKKEQLKLVFQGENSCNNKPIVVTWLMQDMKNERSFKLNTVIVPGQDQKYEKVFTSPEDVWYDVSVRVHANEAQNWKVESLQVKLVS